MSNATKVCADCRLSLPLEAYPVDSASMDGRLNACRSCMKRRRERYAQITDEERQAKRDRQRRPLIKRDFKPCNGCGRTKAIDEYHFAPNTQDRRGGRCKSCERERYQERKRRTFARRRAAEQSGASPS